MTISGIELGAITQDNVDAENPEFKGEMGYVDVKPGRTEFLQEEFRHLEYVIKKIDETSYQVLVESNKSNDAKVFETFIKKKTGKDIKLETLDSDRMSPSNSIKFFDDLAILGMTTNWGLIHVKHLNLRRGDKEEETPDETVLSEIAQAILDGNNLRENPFVKEFERNGYRFTAMTYEFENRNQGYTIELAAEFKLRPKVFEVGVGNFRKRIGLEEKLEKADLDKKDEIEIKTHFWLKAREIYNNLVFPEP